MSDRAGGSEGVVRATGESLWSRTKSIAGEALEMDEAGRGAFVEASCAGDEALRSEVLALLAASGTSPGTLREDGLPAGVLAEVIDEPAVAEGASIGRYTIGRRLGRGGMGTVYEARDEGLGRRVALKLLGVGLASTAARRRFEGEALALARLDHPGIARVYEAGVHSAHGQAVSLPYFAMEFVDEARTLDTFVREARPGVREVLELVARVGDAVHHGHQKGVLHRDLKPSNILISGAGEVKVIDFGVSRLLDARGGMFSAGPATMAGDLVGTPAYLPPEAFELGVHAMDTRADVYAMGVVLYEVLSGRSPFGDVGRTPVQIGDLVRGRPPAMLGTLRSECAGDIETIVAKAMSREPGDRYQSAEQFSGDLRRVLAYEPIVARPTPRVRQMLLFARRNRALVLGVGAVGVALVVGVAGLAVGLSRARASEKFAQGEALRAERVSQFVMKMLRSASPFRGEQFRQLSLDPMRYETRGVWDEALRPGRAPTVGDLIVAAAEHLEESFPGDVALQADMAAVLAQTGSVLSESRQPQLAARAESLLSRAYGRDDPRTQAARQYVYSNMLANAQPSAVDEMRRDLDVIRARARSEDRELLAWARGHWLSAMGQLGRAREAIPLLREMRADLERDSAADSEDKMALDLAILRTDLMESRAAEGLEPIEGLLRRARTLEGGSGPAVLQVLFEKQLFERAAGDLSGAISTLREGAAMSAERYGGKDQRTYEWWSGLYTVAFDVQDLGLAEHAARQQVVGAEAMLGPHSFYTTKAHGRLARALLAQGKNLTEAERSARAAVDGAPELLAIGDGWALYHELLWAWAIRLRGDPVRAEAVIRDRVEVEANAGRPGSVSWVEIMRWTELAQCAMDRATLPGGGSTMSPGALLAVREMLATAERFAKELGPNWPSVQLFDAAQRRFEATERLGGERISK